jgi:hypothetical protein
VLGAAEVEFDVVVVVPVVVDVVVVPVVSVLPGVVGATCGVCGTKALIVRTAWTSGNVDGAFWFVVVVGHPWLAATEQNWIWLTSNRRPAVYSLPFSTRTRFRSRCRKVRRS